MMPHLVAECPPFIDGDIHMRLLALCLAVSLSTAAMADVDADKAAMLAAFQTYQAELKKGDNLAARDAAEEAYKIAQKLYPTPNKTVAALALNYGKLLRGESAAPVLKAAVEAFEVAYGNDAIELIDPLLAYATTQMDFSHVGDARALHERALSIATHQSGEKSQLVGRVYLAMGRSALSEAGSLEARRYLRKAENIFQSYDDTDAEVSLADTHFWLGKYSLATKRHEEAAELMLQSLATFEKYDPSGFMTISSLAFLVEAYERQGLHDEATKYCLKIGAVKPFDSNQAYMPIFRTHPKYPPAALELRIEGAVVVTVTVDDHGFVTEPKVVETSSSAAKIFEAPALEAVKRFRYVPRFVDGKPVATPDVKYKFTFGFAR